MGVKFGEAGHKGGRPKGVPNKVTASAKAAFAEAFERGGGVDALLAWKRENEGEFFKLYARLIPTETQLSGADGAPLGVVILPGVAAKAPE